MIVKNIYKDLGKASLFMFLSLFSSSVSRTLFRLAALGTYSFSAQQFLGAQTFIGCLLVGSLLVIRKLSLFPAQAFSYQILRSLVAVIAYHFLLISLKHFPLYVITVIGLSTVFFTTLGSILCFEHKIPDSKLLAGCFLGFLGGFLCMQHGGTAQYDAAFIAPVLACLLFSLSSLLLKKILILNQKNEPWQQLFSLLFFMSLFLLPSYSSVGQLQELVLLPWSWAFALLYVISQGFYIASYAQAQLSEISPVKFLKIPLALLCDSLVFSHTLQYHDIAGIICVSLGLLVSKSDLSLKNLRMRRFAGPLIQAIKRTKVLS